MLQIQEKIGQVNLFQIKLQFVCLFVYLVFLFHLRIFYSYGDVTITGEVLQILTYARH